MRGGQLRERCEIQALTVGTDSVGGKTKTWAKLTEVWSRWEPTGGAEGEVQGNERTTEDYTVTIRYRAGITAAGNRLLWLGRVFKINSALPDERRESVVMRASAGDGSGSL